MNSLNDQVYKDYLLKYAISRIISERNKWERHLNPDIAEFFYYSVKELNKLDTTLQNPFS